MFRLPQGKAEKPKGTHFEGGKSNYKVSRSIKSAKSFEVPYSKFTSIKLKLIKEKLEFIRRRQEVDHIFIDQFCINLVRRRHFSPVRLTEFIAN